MQKLRSENEELKANQAALAQELDKLRKQLSDLSLGSDTGDDTLPEDRNTEPIEDGEELTQGALRKRLFRICKKRANGNLA